MPLLPLNCMASWTSTFPCSVILSPSIQMVIRIKPEIAVPISGSQSMGARQNHSWGFFKIQVTKPHPNLLDLLEEGPRVCAFLEGSTDDSDGLPRWRTTAQDTVLWSRDGFCSQLSSLTANQPFSPSPCHYGARVSTCLAPESSRVVIVEGGRGGGERIKTEFTSA